MKIEFSGIELSARDKEMLGNLIVGYPREEHTRIFHIDIKAHEKEGKRMKYVVNLNVTTNFGRFQSEDFGWNLQKVTKEAIRKIERQVDHAMGRQA